MASSWARQRFDWLDQVLADREMTPACFVIAYAISKHANKDTGSAFPAQSTLKATTGLTERHIRTSTQLLASRGHLHMSKPQARGPGNVITYTPILKSRPAEPEPTLFADAEMAPPAPKVDAPPIGDFEAWWSQYPRKVSKGAARTAYDRVIKSGKASHEELVAGALRYSAERTGQDQQFTKHGASWLNQECWADEPASSATFDACPPGRPTSFVDIALRSLGGDDE